MTIGYDQLFHDHEVVTVGKLVVPTGTIVACDPFFVADASHFSRSVPSGSYDVQLCMTGPSHEWHNRTALSRVVIQPQGTAAKFVVAETSGGGNSCFVESGLAAFLDEEARVAFASLLAQFYKKNPSSNYYSDVLKEELLRPTARAKTGGNKWALHAPFDTPSNIAVFSSGIGDGSYQCWWGLDAYDEPTCLVMDFQIL